MPVWGRASLWIPQNSSYPTDPFDKYLKLYPHY